MLFRATRIERTLYILSLMIIPCAFVNRINVDVLLFALSCIFLYSSMGLFNAIKDKDYDLPRYAKLISLFLVFLSLLISFFNKIIFITFLLWLILGVIYNTIARKILFADAFILSFHE